MKEIISSISKLSVPTAINFISSVIKNKILALVVGPVGLGIYSQFINLSTLLSSVLPMGSIGLVRYISNYYVNERQKEINFFIIYFLKRNFVLSIIFTIVLLFFYNTISSLLFSDSSFGYLVALFSFFISFNLLLNFVDIYFKGIREINKYAFFLSLNSIASTIISVPLIYYFGLEGAILALLFSVVINLMTGIIILKKNKLLPDFTKSQIVDKSVMHNIYKLGLGAMIILIAQQVTTLVIKSIIAARLGLESVGIFQSVYSISNGYFGIFFSLLLTYSIPKISTFKKTSEINQELNNTIKLLLMIYTPLIIALFVTRSFVISVFYSGEFLDAKYLLVFQLPAELIRALSWAFGLWLVPNLRIKQWIIFDIIFYLLFFSLFYILLEYFKWGLQSVSIAYLIAYVIFSLINLFYSVYSIDFRFSEKNLKILGFSLPLVALAFVISQISESLGLFVLLPILVAWSLLVYRKGDLAKLKNSFLSKRNF